MKNGGNLTILGSVLQYEHIFSYEAMLYSSFRFLRSEPLIIDSGLPGPTLMVLGGVHGDELPGIFAVQSFIDQRASMKLESGRLILMFGNLEAIQRNTRQYKANLNRMFHTKDSAYTAEMKRTYEYHRAMEIKSSLVKADVLLDIHSVAHRNAQPFVICESNGLELARSLPVSLLCSGFDSAHPGGTDGYMNSLGKIGFCLECGEHRDPDGYTRAKKAVWSMLGALGMILPGSLPETLEETVYSGSSVQLQGQQEQKHVRVFFIYKNRQETFQLARAFDEFEEVHEGELIGYDGLIPVLAPEKSRIVFPRNKVGLGEECFCLAK